MSHVTEDPSKVFEINEHEKFLAAFPGMNIPIASLILLKYTLKELESIEIDELLDQFSAIIQAERLELFYRNWHKEFQE